MTTSDQITTVVICVIAVLVVGAVPFALLGRSIGQSKNAQVLGFWLGLLLGPLGLVITLFSDGRIPCPFCGDKINGKPEICKSCQTRFRWDGDTCTYYPPKESSKS